MFGRTLLRSVVAALLSAALSIALSMAETAGQAERKLIIHLKSGKTVTFPLSEVESIRFEDSLKGSALAPGRPSRGPGRTDAEQSLGPIRLLSGAGSLSGGWGPGNLFDGDAGTGWSSRPGARFPHEFIIEFPQSVFIGAMEFDNAVQEQSYPGASTRAVTVQASNVGPSGPFQNLATLSLAPGANHQRFAIPPVTVRWLRLLILSNYGHANYTQLMDVRFFPPSDRTRP